MIANRIAVKLAFFINGFIYANWVARLPRIQEIYHADNGTIGLVLLASSLGAVAAMPFTGWVIIKNGSRAITLFSALFYCLVVPLIPHMPGIVALVVLYLGMGIVTGMLDIAINAQAVLVERQYNRPIMTSFHALFSIGMMLGAWSGALFVDLLVDLSTHLMIIVGVSLLMVLWMSRNLVNDRPNPEEHHEGPLFRLPNRLLLSIGIIAFCCMLAEGAMADWSVNYMLNVANANRTLAPLGLSAFATAMTGGRIFGDRVRARLGDRKLMIASGLLATAGLCVALIVPLPYATMAGFALVGLGLSTVVPIAYSIAGNVRDLPSGVGLAMVTTVGYAGFLFGPPIIGFVADWQNLRIGLSVVLVLLVIMTYLGVAYKPKS